MISNSAADAILRSWRLAHKQINSNYIWLRLRAGERLRNITRNNRQTSYRHVVNTCSLLVYIA
jgi:hypothetical protein